MPDAHLVSASQRRRMTEPTPHALSSQVTRRLPHGRGRAGTLPGFAVATPQSGRGTGAEKLLNKMGIWHFDQVAAWTAKELKWVDERLEGFKGRLRATNG